MKFSLWIFLILFSARVIGEPLTHDFIDKVIGNYFLCKEQDKKDECIKNVHKNIEHMWLYKTWLNVQNKRYYYEAVKFSNGISDESKSIIMYIDNFDTYKRVAFSEVGSNMFLMNKGDLLKVIFDKEKVYYFKVDGSSDKIVSLYNSANMFIDLLKKSSQVEVEIPTTQKKKVNILFNLQDFKSENF